MELCSCLLFPLQGQGEVLEPLGVHPGTSPRIPLTVGGLGALLTGALGGLFFTSGFHGVVRMTV